MTDLYKEEQELLKNLVESETNKEYQNALKRTILRLNKEMENQEKKKETSE
ncbi:hypothetical protein [Lentibacillus sediminis]|uniref:hypothetical protein n=1 Tax=Lentibacillus sediminis TaxID=1940529 RepID=UPI001304451B|nr:hypothetical protein [Lentibacillus sediminis]